MKLLQLNIWGGRLGSKIKELIQREQPDVVCFQEAIKVAGGRGFIFDELGEIQKDTNFDYCYFSPSLQWKLMQRKAEFGLAIMSKTPFLSSQNAFIGLELNTDFDITTDDYNVRSLQHVTISHNDNAINILNYHGHHVPDHKNGDAETMRQCLFIAEYAKTLVGSIILCGDFNLNPNSESLELINATLVNHTKEQGIGTTRTLLTHKTEVCDYIFTSSDIRVRNFQVLDDIASDHKALTIEI